MNGPSIAKFFLYSTDYTIATLIFEGNKVFDDGERKVVYLFLLTHIFNRN